MNNSEPIKPTNASGGLGLVVDLLALFAIGFSSYYLWGKEGCLFALGVACYWKRPI